MKDLYTFDINAEEALMTYKTVREAYAAFFDELKLPYLVAKASSGEIGGDLSHEYHFPSSRGEDRVISCGTCAHTINEELAGNGSSQALSREHIESQQGNGCGFCHWYGVSGDRSTLVQAIFPEKVSRHASGKQSWRESRVNPHPLKQQFPFLDMSVEDGLKVFQDNTTEKVKKIILIYDYRVPHALRDDPSHGDITKFGEGTLVTVVESRPDLVRVETGDKCQVCETGTLVVENAVELGHTFHLGTRYSEPLTASVAVEPAQQGYAPSTGQALGYALMQMGCHGIGVSRLIAAVADSLADKKGLKWPSIIAPFQVLIVPTKGQEDAAEKIYDLLCNSDKTVLDAVIDDREKEFGWKLKDADLIGYPVIVIVGRDWQTQRQCEVQCRRVAGGLKDRVPVKSLQEHVQTLLRHL